MGRFVSCVGECLVYRGFSFIRARSRSLLQEGDEIRMGKNSYAWIFLWDGSLLRVSPETGLSLREFNVTTEGFFVFLRLNWGHIFVLNRAREGTGKQMPETDTLFLPLPQDLGKGFQGSSGEVAERGRSQRVQNQKQMPLRPSRWLITMTNGTLFSEDVRLDVFHQQEGESFFRYGREGLVEFWYRGYERRLPETLQGEKVYRVAPQGLSLGEEGPELFFARTSLVVKRIAHLLFLREKWLVQYAKGLHPLQFPPPEEFSLKTGFRLWGGWDAGEEMSRRLRFLEKLTRREETRYGYVLKKFRRERREEDPPSLEVLPRRYEERGFRHYLRSLKVRNKLHSLK